MRIILWHGYLLTGSGSNLYTANVARVWRARGHDVLLMCQERRARGLDFIDAEGDFDADNACFRTISTDAPAADGEGRCRLVRPNIGAVLPVYVYDLYEGFTAKRFVDITDDELTAYTSANVDALTAAIEQHRPDAIVTGHEVMGPYIAREACRATGTTYLAKLHGSALEYAVKEQSRYREFASAGLTGAKVVAGGSRYMIEEASKVVPGWRDRATVVNPGCDVGLFQPTEAAERDPTVGYVGKLMASKGVHHLLAALGHLHIPNLSAVIVGYGGLEVELRALWTALRTGDTDTALAIARTGEGEPLEELHAWLLSGVSEAASYRARAAAVDVSFLGRLEHGPLARVLPDFDVIAVPSVVPEAFGMVAAEAAACAVLPVVPAHSGIGEVGATLELELGAPGLLTYEPTRPITDLAGALDRILSLPAEERRALGLAAAEVARRRWSWERVAGDLLQLAAG